MMKKYAALRTIGTILKILGITNGVITILLSLGACLLFGFVGTQMGGMMYDITGYPGDMGASIITGVLMGLAILIYGGLSALLIYGTGELIYVLLDIEQNTRDTVEVLRFASGNKPT
jgi:hypothetical protein